MKSAVLFLGALLLSATASAQDAFVRSGRCGTTRLRSAAACACYWASITRGTPKEMILACQTAFGNNLASLKSYCLTSDAASFKRELTSLKDGCATTFSKEKVIALSPDVEAKTARNGLEEIDSGSDMTPVGAKIAYADRKLYPFYWPLCWPHWFCYNWYWCIWWWIVRFWWCFLHWHGVYYKYCPWW